MVTGLLPAPIYLPAKSVKANWAAGILTLFGAGCYYAPDLIPKLELDVDICLLGGLHV
jgi:hypothetical protein